MMPTLVASALDALLVLRRAKADGRAFTLVLTDVQMPETDGFTLAEAIKKDPSIADATLVMLTSAGRPGDAARCRALGVGAYLTKPIRRSELRSAILLALSVRSAAGAAPMLVTRHSLREALPARRILLVADNRIDQLVARRLLERRGHAVVLAHTGREALAILDEATFAGFGCLLIDVQMSEMDGFECTALIRVREQTMRSHLPIIAMTANVKGDDRRCRAAGMDAYLSKPIQPEELFEAVDRVLGAEAVPEG
jgi:CheY-like chemotaxis protein